MRIILLFVVFSAIILSAQNNDGIIKGVIKTSEDKPAAFANIKLKETLKGSTANSNGEYEITNVEPGNYILEITLVGFETKEKEIQVKAGETVIVPTFYLSEKPKELSEVIIEDRADKFSNKESDYVAKLPVRNLENPQSYSTITQELISDQNITDYASALKIIPGGVISSENGVGYAAIYIRGFVVNSYIRDGLYDFSPSGGDPQVLERIELIRGPSGPMFGTSSVNYGGLVNKVTKKPFSDKYVNIGLSLGSYDLQRFTTDINLPLDDEKKLLFRLNTALHSEGTFQDYGYRKSFVIAPSFYYKINNNFDVLFSMEINSISHSSPTLFNGAVALGVKRIDEIKRDYFKLYTSDNLNSPPITHNNYFGQLNYKLSANWKLSTNIAVADYLLDGSSIIPAFVNDSIMTRQLYDYKLKINTVNLQQNINGEFFLSSFRNRFVAGVDYQRAEATQSNYLVFVADSVNYKRGIIPSLNLGRLRANYNFVSSNNESRNTYAIYFSDLISFTEQLNVMLSLRLDYYDYTGNYELISGTTAVKPYGQKTLSPQAGFTYELIEDQLTLFANYMQGFNNVNPNTQGQNFKREFAEQMEAGVKLNLFHDHLYSTISYYNISVRDKIRPDRDHPPLSIQDGTQLSRGADVDLRFTSDNGLNLIAGYSYNESKFTKADISVEGKRPLGTPKHTANFWGSYSFRDNSLQGLGIGTGMIYSSNYFFDDRNLLIIPSYTLLRASLFYDYPKFRITFSMENLTNKKYWDYNGAPQMPRKVVLSLNIIL